MTTEANKATLMRYLEAVWHGGQLDAASTYITPDYQRHDLGLPMPIRGPEGVAQLVGLYRVAFPDLHLTPVVLLAEGDTVAAHWDVRGTHQGELMGLPPTGKPIAITATEIFRFVDGKIAEQWVTVDNLGMLRQLGAAP